MRKEAPFSVTYLRSVLNYLPEDGLFYWRDRDDLDVRNAARLAGAPAGHVSTSGHHRIKIDGRQSTSARLAWFYMTGKWPETKVYSIDGDPLNLKWNNLQVGRPFAQKHSEPFSLEYLRARLTYDASTGDLLHRQRRFVSQTRAGYFNQGVLKTRIEGRTYTAAKIAWFLETGEWPEHQVQFRNGNKTDLRWSNLCGPTSSQLVSIYREKPSRPVAPFSAEQLRRLVEYREHTGAFILLAREGDPEWTKRFAGRRADRLLDNNKVAVTIDGRLLDAAQLAWLYMTGEWAEKVKFKDDCTWDVSFANLEVGVARARKVLPSGKKRGRPPKVKNIDLEDSGSVTLEDEQE